MDIGSGNLEALLDIEGSCLVKKADDLTCGGLAKNVNHNANEGLQTR